MVHGEGRSQTSLDGGILFQPRPLRFRPYKPNGLPDVTDVDDMQAVLDLLRQVPNVLAVLGRQEDRLDARAEGADEFLLDAPDGRYAAAEGDFALRERG